MPDQGITLFSLESLGSFVLKNLKINSIFMQNFIVFFSLNPINLDLSDIIINDYTTFNNLIIYDYSVIPIENYLKPRQIIKVNNFNIFNIFDYLNDSKFL